MRVLLEIGGDASALKTVLAGVEGDIRKTQGTITGETRRGARERVSASQQESAEIKRLARDVMAGCAKGERERTKAADDERKKREAGERRETKVAEAEGKKRAANDAAFNREKESISVRLKNARAKNEADATKKAAAEGAKRKADDAAFEKLHQDLSQKLRNARTADEEAVQKKAHDAGAKNAADDAAFERLHQDLSQRLRNARSAAEEAATRKASQEARKRVRIAEQEARDRDHAAASAQHTIGSAAAQVGGVAVGAAGAVHSAIQGGRDTAEGVEHALRAALRTTGDNDADRQVAYEEVVNYANKSGIPIDAAVAGLASAQGEFNVLGSRDQTPAQRAAARRAGLSNMRLAYRTDQDYGQVARVGGLLAQTGLSETQQHDALLGLTGMAQMGAVELRNVGADAMGPLSQAMGNAMGALPPGATEAQRRDAAMGALRESFSQAEVAHSVGLDAHESTARFAQVQSLLRDPRHQTNLYHHMQAMERRDRAAGHGAQADLVHSAESQMFTADGHGGHTLNAAYQDPLAFGERMGVGMGGDPSRLRSLMGNMGTGLRQVFHDNDVGLWTSLMTPDVSGRTGYDRRRMILGARLTDADLDDNEREIRRERGQGSIDARNTALYGSLFPGTNRRPIQDLSDHAGDWVRGHGIESSLLALLGPKAASLALRGMTTLPGAVLTAGVGSVIGMLGAFTGKDLAGGSLGVARRLSSLATPSLEGGVEIGGLARDWVAGQLGLPNGPGGTGPRSGAPLPVTVHAGTSPIPVALSPEDRALLRGAVPSPTAQAHNATQAHNAAAHHGRHGR